MMPTHDKIKALFPRASKATIDLNPDVGLQDPVAQRSLCHRPVGATKGETQGAGRVVLRYQSFRQRLLDIDNLAGGTKFLTDALRYCGAIRNDSQDEIDLKIEQTKVATKAEEKTIVRIESI